MREFLGILFLFYFFFVSRLQAGTEYELPPIVMSGTPGAVLLEDPIVPAYEGSTQLNSGTGSVQNSLQDQLSLPITNLGQPGNMGQLRGLGLSAEEVDVQAFGISLNPPQGGGFDLSVFPQFLWSNYRYQQGPSLNSLNQSASTGTLSLIPWTVQALKEPGFGGRASEFCSTLGVNQISVAARKEESIAIVGGYSSGKVIGPSGSLSSRWKSGNYMGSFHMLASDLDAESPGATSYRTPRARTQNTRFIPVLQSDYRLSKSELMKTSLFYDENRLNYSDPESSTYKQRTRQFGFESAYLVKQWKLGLNVRRVTYFSDTFRAPLQNIGNVHLARGIDLDSVFVEPLFQGIWVTGYGLLPQGSLGARTDWDDGRQALYSRTSFSRRIPSLLDRYASYRENPYLSFVGNPDLQIETDWTGILGWEGKLGKFEGTIEGYAQLRKNPKVLLGSTVTNLNDATILALSNQSKAHILPFLDLFSHFTLTHSRVLASNREFPYVPLFAELFGFTFHSKVGSGGWDWTTAARYASPRVYNSSLDVKLPSYFVMDTSVRYEFTKDLSLSGRVENIFDRKIEIIEGYPIGRNASILLVGQI